MVAAEPSCPETLFCSTRHCYIYRIQPECCDYLTSYTVMCDMTRTLDGSSRALMHSTFQYHSRGGGAGKRISRLRVESLQCCVSAIGSLRTYLVR